MIINCPNCDARYEVDVESFPREGRQVRCARCREVWHAVGEDDSPPQAGGTGTSLVPVAAGGGEEEFLLSEGAARLAQGDGEVVDPVPPQDAHEACRRERARFAGRRRGAGRRTLQALVLGMAAAALASALVKREDVVRAVPEAAALFAYVGLPVNLRGLAFESVALERSVAEGLPVLVVNGEVVNLRREPVTVPALRFALRGRRGEELYSWTVEPRQREIEPGGRMSFRSRLAAPPSGADDVEVRFTERGRQSARIGP